MMYKAFVRDVEDGRKLFIDSDYQNKRAFEHDLHANGYAVIKIEPKALYDFMLEQTDCQPEEWKIAKAMWREHLPLTREEMRNYEALQLLCGGDSSEQKLWFDADRRVIKER